ncbi:subtilisin family serine protease/C-terminal processing protease CtpA/Prc [Azospirillum sp. OGB3]|uniref:S8 family serine peptidase n=1 Tax=Azospirillum sp. OGB3 TaxID=2587012 RepID=UPI0016068D07|nr:S8 family serine peptidase [Azospirillum sp. OGB3]MBB3265208.1 subtilisin family serine protease/C-terminal processing protease CtpA/Prc [Azospirillum sp. OGB3]
MAMGDRPNPMSNPTDSSTDAQAVVRDDSNQGVPFIPASATGQSGLNANVAPLSPAVEDVVVEVEFARGVAPVGAALAGDTSAFLSGTGGPFAPIESELSAVLRQFGLQEARLVSSPEQVRTEQARLASLRQAAAMGAATAEQVSALESLPPLDGFVRLRFPPGTKAAEVTAALKRLPEVARAVVVPRAMPPAVSLAPPPLSDPLVGNDGGPLTQDPATGLEWQWYLHRTRAPHAWRFARGAGVVVADIDWGFRTTHNELRAGIERRYNAVDGGADVSHGNFAAHGTAVLGIAGARADGAGIAGYAPEADLWAVQGDSAPTPSVFEESWAEAIDWVRRTDSSGRRKVIILEVQTATGGNYEQIPVVHRAVRAAIADGCVVCVAAGNGDRPADRTDAGDPFDPTGSILVGATAYALDSNKRAFFSNYGRRVVVSAPGDPAHDLTCGQAADNAYRNGFGGTSGATPKVAGTIALMLSVNPGLSHADVRDILAGTGMPLLEDPGKPVGVFLNTEAAVAEALRRRGEITPSPVPHTPGAEASPEPGGSRATHGVRRRQRQLVLPDDPRGPLVWPSAAPEATAADASAAPEDELPPAGDQTLRRFRESVEGTLTQQDRILIVEQAIKMLDNFYVHRPLKEAIHAVRPIQRLRVLQRRLQQQLQQQADIPAGQRDELAFHNTLTQIFNSVRDLHTNYLLPRPYRDYIAYLPFEVAPFYEANCRRYLVTRVTPGYRFAAAAFGPGVELLNWNGMAIERAVLANADQTAGSNEAARHARGVSSLTIRPMNTALPPDADFVDLEFVPPGTVADDPAARVSMRQSWFVRYAPATVAQVQATVAAGTPPSRAATPPVHARHAQSSLDLSRESIARSADLIFEPPKAAAPSPASTPQPRANLALAGALGLDVTADAVREARQLLFEPDILRVLQDAADGQEICGTRSSASPESAGETAGADEIKVRVPWNAAFRARSLTVKGHRFGHICIRTFYVDNPDGFIDEFIRLLGQIPETGLILDVRGNGGGHIWAAERLLQTLSPVEIEPERMLFVVTPGTVDLCHNNPATSQIPLHLWQSSLDEAVETGSVYSHAFPVTDPASCNAIGQCYYGPVVLIVDGNCYSATDIFSAGFQDHRIGPILGVSDNTGAGGANVWEHWLLTAVLPFGWGLKPLPNQAGMRVAVRQCLRVKQRAGALLEDFGVVPDHIHKVTRADVMHGDPDLLADAADLLLTLKPRGIKLTVGASDPGNPANKCVAITTRGLDRLDFFIDDRPLASVDLTTDTAGVATLQPSVRIGARLKLVGFERENPEQVALYKGTVS